ncbi:hypothetical protein AMTRI_Chr12g239720 [Amborella trichopoda]
MTSPTLPKPSSSWERVWALLQGMDLKVGHGMRSWTRVDSYGDSQVLEVDKFTMMERCDLPARDLRMLDPLLDYPPTIRCREKAILVNLEHTRCIITADEVLLLSSSDKYVLEYVQELQRTLTMRNDMGVGDFPTPSGGDLVRREGSMNIDDFLGNRSRDNWPFEFRALEVGLEAACTFLHAQATELEIVAYPLLDKVTSNINTLNVELVRQLKSRLVPLTRKVQKVRDEIEQLMDNDRDMAEMQLTKKKSRMEATQNGGGLAMTGYGTPLGEALVSVPASPVSTTETPELAKSFSLLQRRHGGIKRWDSSTKNTQVLEVLLEAYFVNIDSILNKFTALKEYIDDRENFINIQLNNVRNQLIQLDLLLTTSSFVMAIFGAVAGVFGMNFPISLYREPAAFKWVLTITGAVGLSILCSVLWFFRRRRLMLL